MESMTGNRIIPLSIPKPMMKTQVRKNTTNVYNFAKNSIDMERKVEKPPWKTDEPI